MAIKIYKQYGDSAVAVVSRNPYALIENVDGIGFLTADKMAKTLGVAHNVPAVSPSRQRRRSVNRLLRLSEKSVLMNFLRIFSCEESGFKLANSI
jgi:ATP-dependent exoDNAse (exonuclease V) alpha subunit